MYSSSYPRSCNGLGSGGQGGGGRGRGGQDAHTEVRARTLNPKTTSTTTRKSMVSLKEKQEKHTTPSCAWQKPVERAAGKGRPERPPNAHTFIARRLGKKDNDAIVKIHFDHL